MIGEAKPARILVADDDDSFRRILSIQLDEAGYAVVQARDGTEAVRLADEEHLDLVITDLRMPGLDGHEVVRRVRYRRPSLPVIVLTAHGSIESAVEAMRLGAHDYVGKPVDRKELLAIVAKTLRTAVRDRDVVHASDAMSRVVSQVQRVAAADSPVLITGESGTGKEVVARMIHGRSPRSRGPLVAVNCAAIPSELLESEVFGHVKGAFSGASAERAGKFREADGGTILLDEVGDMAPGLQAKLLRVLDNGVVDVLGSDRPVRVDVRVLASTNRDLDELVSQGQFRRDLLFRLDVISIHVPPLRERPDDLDPLLRHFLHEVDPDGVVSFDDEAMERLRRHDWPGNVRELRNVVERVYHLREGDRLGVRDLPGYLRREARRDVSAAIDLPDSGVDLKGIEASLIRRALEKNDWNQSATARYLNVPRHVLLYRMHKFGIEPPDG